MFQQSIIFLLFSKQIFCQGILKAKLTAVAPAQSRGRKTIDCWNVCMSVNQILISQGAVAPLCYNTVYSSIACLKGWRLSHSYQPKCSLQISCHTPFIIAVCMWHVKIGSDNLNFQKAYLVVASFSPRRQSHTTMQWLSSKPTVANRFPSAINTKI